ncbi:MAG: hypothetical protein ABI768_00650 [Acidobacteriota bacterium]
MKLMRTNVWVPAFAAVLLLSACGGKKEAPKPAPGSAAAAANPGAATAPAAAAPASAPAQIRLDAFRLGYALGPDAQVRGEGNTFAKGDKVFVSYGMRDAKAGSSTKVVWVKNPAGTKVSEESKPLPPDPGTVSFVAETATWANGEYAVEMWVVEPSAEPRRLGVATLTVSAGRGK